VKDLKLASEKFNVRRRAAGQRALLMVLGTAVLATLGVAQPALASKTTEEYAVFSDCPVASAAECIVSTTTGGEFKIGSKAVPISVPIVLQGGLLTREETENTLVAALDGNTLSRTPLPVPGGLTGIPGLEIGQVLEVTATAEIAGPASSVHINREEVISSRQPGIVLPLKVKLSNSVLGEECYIGTDAEPILLHLTTGTTSPPAPNTPITGSRGTFHNRGQAGILEISGVSLVDNSFSAPGATGCGGALSAVIDPVIDLDIGLPAAAGTNTAIMNSKLEQAAPGFVTKFWQTPTIQSVNPSSGPKAGGTQVTVTGTGFAIGSGVTAFKFGSLPGTSVNCTSNTTCTVLDPATTATKAKTVDVKASVYGKNSPVARPADQFTYQ
jgi:hypothetical protein